MTENYRLEFKQWNEFRRDFLAALRMVIKNRCVEKEWYFILTEELHTLARSLQ
jgi:hypothetical protein